MRVQAAAQHPQHARRRGLQNPGGTGKKINMLSQRICSLRKAHPTSPPPKPLADITEFIVTVWVFCKNQNLSEYKQMYLWFHSHGKILFRERVHGQTP